MAISTPTRPTRQEFDAVDTLNQSVANEAAMLAATVVERAVVYRVDVKTQFRFVGGDSTDIANWSQVVDADSDGVVNALFIPRAEPATNLDSQVGTANEVAIDTTNQRVRLMDGATPGGVVIGPDGLRKNANGSFQLIAAAGVAPNALGPNAIDLSTIRNNSDEVASGDSAMNFGPAGTASGGDSINFGREGEATQTGSINFGKEGVASGFFAVNFGSFGLVEGSSSINFAGNNSIVRSNSSINFGSGGLLDTGSDGSFNTANDGRSTAQFTSSFGLSTNATLYGQFILASGQFSSVGDCQKSNVELRRSVAHTTNDWSPLFLDGFDDLMVIPINTSWTFHAYITGVTSGIAKSVAYTAVGMIKNIAGVVTIKGVDIIAIDNTDDPDFQVQIVADDANDALSVEVKVDPFTGETVRWSASVGFKAVTFA